MTLDIRKYLENLIDKEAKVSHFSMVVRAGKAEKVKGQVASQIRGAYGDNFLADADYVLFFTKQEGWTAKDIKKLFELTNRALGEDANRLAKTDFVALKSAAPADDGEEPEDGEEEVGEADEEAAKTLFVKVTIK